MLHSPPASTREDSSWAPQHGSLSDPSLPLVLSICEVSRALYLVDPTNPVNETGCPVSPSEKLDLG